MFVGDVVDNVGEVVSGNNISHCTLAECQVPFNLQAYMDS